MAGGKLREKYIVASIKALTRLAYRLKKPEIISSFLMSENPVVISECLEEVDKSLKHVNFTYVLSLYDISGEAIYAARRLARKKDNRALKELLKRLTKDRDVLEAKETELILAICETGGPPEFRFLLELFLNYEGELHLGGMPILNSIASLATTKHMPLLESIVRTELFWLRSYDDEGKRDQISVRNYANLYFIKWLVGVTYARLADRTQLDTLRQMLTHPFWTVRNAAVERLGQCGKPSDISWLIEDTLACSSEPEGLLRALCRLDEKFYPLMGAEVR